MKPISRLTMLAAYLVCLATALMTSSPATAATVSRAKRIPVVFSAPSTAIALKVVRGSYVIAPVSGATFVGVEVLKTNAISGQSAWVTIKTVKMSPSGTGAIVLPGEGVGAWHERLAAETSKHRVLGVSAFRAIHTYGAISLTNLCSGVGSANNGSCSSSTAPDVQINGTIYPNVISDVGATPYQSGQAGDPVLFDPSSSCSSITLTFMVDSEDGNVSGNELGYVSVAQSGVALNTATASAYTSGSFEVTLNGGPFYVNVQGTVGSDSSPNAGSPVADIYINGTAICYTTSGVR